MKLYTVKVMANCLDLSERRVRQLREEGILIEAAPGLYELWPNVRRYINFLRGNADGKADLNEERAKLTREKRIAAEQENKVKSGELYRKQDIMLGLSTMLMNLRSRMMALPNKLAPSTLRPIRAQRQEDSTSTPLPLRLSDGTKWCGSSWKQKKLSTTETRRK